MKVIIVDDEIDTLKEIEYYVKEHGGFEYCEICTNSKEAILKSKETNFDIALLDIEMPIMNGLELAENFNSQFPEMSIAFITAYNTHGAEAFDLNAIDYILKPLRKERLYKALDKLIKVQKGKALCEKKEPEVVITTFGKMMLKVDGKIVKWNRSKSLELFSYLLQKRAENVNKEKLCDLLWPDIDTQKALVNLQTTIYAVRKTLGEYGCNRDYICIDYSVNNYIMIVKKAIIDVDEFEMNIEKAQVLDDISFLEKAVDIYKGKYLEEDGWFWAETQKEMLHKKYINAIKKLKITNQR